MEEKKFPLPPFTLETALQKVQLAEDAWNSRDPEIVSLAYSINTEWRNRAEFINGREEVKTFRYRKWEKELKYRPKKEPGGSGRTGWQYGSSTNGITMTDNGSVVTATN